MIFLSKVKEVVTAILNGDMDHATARLILMQTLKALGYTPEGGFPEDEGTVPPAVAGTLQDLSSRERLDLIINTQRDLMRGLGQKARGMTPEALDSFPAWELVRAYERAEPRHWGGKHQGTPVRTPRGIDPRSRWEIAGGRAIKTPEGYRLIAFKGDPIWGELGSSGNFDDALDVDFPPFAFNSGMSWSPITYAECLDLGVTGPNGESVEEWLAEERPVMGGVQEPVISLKKADPVLVKKFEEQTGASVEDGLATTAGGREALLRKLAERKAAREARLAELMERALAK
ncbi:MAG: hypothetical protein ACQKBY_11240 [Verrucomicrobiales bacterium]